MASFQVTLGAMIDSVLRFTSHTRKNTGIAPKVFPSFGRVAYTGNGTIRVSSSTGHPAPDAPGEPVAAAGGPESRQPISAANHGRLIGRRPPSASRRLYGPRGRIATRLAFRIGFAPRARVLHRNCVRVFADLPPASRAALPMLAREWLLPSRTLNRRILPPAIGLAYIAVIAVLGGLRPDHVFIGLLGLLDLYNEKTRLFLAQFFPFIATGVIFDSMRYFYWPAIDGRVHVAGPYLLERDWFGIRGQTPNEWLDAHHTPALDLACGFAYLVYVGEYLAVALLLFFRRRSDALRTFALCFLAVNLLGFATYFIYPVAPPWYVTQYGLGPARMDIHPAAAAASRFDQLLGTHFFEGMYGRGVDVYGAFPSLHVAYPLIATWTVFRTRELRWLRAPAVLFFLLMCLSAVYLQHHYVLDVLLGIGYSGVTVGLLAWWRIPISRKAARASSAQPVASGSPRAVASIARRSAFE
jgi:membrane-associated phospholipid phosphatase